MAWFLQSPIHSCSRHLHKTFIRLSVKISIRMHLEFLTSCSYWKGYCQWIAPEEGKVNHLFRHRYWWDDDHTPVNISKSLCIGRHLLDSNGYYMSLLSSHPILYLLSTFKMNRKQHKFQTNKQNT